MAPSPFYDRWLDMLIEMVEQGRAPFHDLTFRVEVGPLREDDLMAGRWIGEGRYAGGMPGASAEPGTLITFRGSDFFRLEGDRIAEYWVSSDGVHLMSQLGMRS
jgi:predicted ester cyclase